LGIHTIKVILFDLGGVLVRWDGVRELTELAAGKLNREQSRRFFLESTWMKLFETGSCSPEEFADGVVAELNLSLKPDEFLPTFISWDRGFYPGALELLDRLKPHFLLACLSNNNTLHWSRLCKRYSLGERFHQLYASHETGLVKPSQEAFEYVLNDIGGAPEEYLFFDDNRECVQKAQHIGFNACQVSGVEEVTRTLKELKLFH
jgi:HAD superfamily hydrolase (TIGR01509 family)